MKAWADPHRATWPWRGLALAAWLAVLAHLAVFMLTQTRFTFSFKRPDNTSSLTTRMIEPVPVSLAPPGAAPDMQSVLPKRTAPAAPIRAEPAPTDNTATKPREAPNLEPKQPLADMESAQSATETVATNAPISANEVASIAASAGGTPASPGLKLAYPASAKLQFDGTFMRKGSAQTGSGLLSWSVDGASYVLSLEATALVILSQTELSTGALSPQGLAPQTYSSKRTGRSEQATHFRPEIGKIQFSNNKPDAVLMVGAQDRLSALVQLAGIIGGDPERFKIVNRIQMQVAGLENAEVWEFNLEGISDINLPAANMQALKLSRTPRNEFDQRLEIWLSPQLGYLPVRIRQSSSTTPDQDFTDLVLRVLPAQRPLLPAV